MISLNGNIAFSFMFYWMNLVGYIFWIWHLVPFLVVCFYFSQYMFGKQGRTENVTGPRAKKQWPPLPRSLQYVCLLK